MAGVLEYNLTGNAPGAGPAQHEDLSDLLAVVDAKSTPVTSMIPKGRAAGATTFHWQADAHVAAKNIGVIDGTDVTTTLVSSGNNNNDDLTSTSANRKVLKNNVQIYRRSGRVSLLSENVANPAGVRSELAHMVSRLILTQKRDIETSLSSKSDAQDGNLSDPFLTKALQSWLSPTGQTRVVTNASGTSVGANHDCPCVVPDAFQATADATSSTTKAAFTADKVQDVLEAIYNETGVVRDYDLICDSQVKRAFTGFAETSVNEAATTENHPATRVRTLNKEQADRSFVSTIDIFTGDFGTLRLHVSNFLEKGELVDTTGSEGAATISTDQDNSHGYGMILPMDMLELKYNMTTNVKPMTNNGAGEGRIITTIAGLAHKNPLSSGSISFTAAA
tara:strand:+ start:4952 stop:6127 length:1176 start_codon:yes stop_codon:yes gene_type:complete